MWLDDKGNKNKISAPQYVDYVMTYVQKVVNDEATFPTKHGNEFPANFDQVLRKIQKLLFHVVAHIYHSHFREVTLNNLYNKKYYVSLKLSQKLTKDTILFRNWTIVKKKSHIVI